MHSESLVISLSLHKYNSLNLVCILIGFIPVGCIALHVLELLPLSTTAYTLALPGLILVFIAGFLDNSVKKLALRGWLIGVIAVAFYDCSRIPFVYAGWNDFVPHIGDWILKEEGTNKLIGYSWRYIGNGGGMGITFVFLLRLIKRTHSTFLPGIVFGLFIFAALMLTLLIAPHSEILMFRITPLIVTGSLVGHLIYGGVLGLCLSFFKEKNLKRRRFI